MLLCGVCDCVGFGGCLKDVCVKSRGFSVYFACNFGGDFVWRFVLVCMGLGVMVDIVYVTMYVVGVWSEKTNSLLSK